ncbi:MAG: hypothetical protein ACOYKZ_05810 [Chlamydiia bacterium]
MKSERLKKLESELHDLEEWLKLGLVPKKEIPRHQEEIRQIQVRMEEERERLRMLKESGDGEEFVTPRRSNQARAAYPDSHTLPDAEIGEESASESSFDMESDGYESESSTYYYSDAGESAEEESGSAEEEDDDQSTEDEDDPFSDRNRWRRGPLEDPDVDRW